MQASRFRSFRAGNFRVALFASAILALLFLAAPSRAQEAALQPENTSSTPWQESAGGHYFAKIPHPAFGEQPAAAPEPVAAIEPAAGEEKPAEPSPEQGALADSPAQKQ